MNQEINYQFTPVPTNLIYMLDSHCLHLMAALLQKYYYWKNKNKLAQDDTFYYSLNEIDVVLNNANQKDTRLTIEALYRAGLIRVENYNGRRITTRFGINWDAIEDIEKMTIQDIKDCEVYITKLPRSSKITYTNCSTKCSTDCSTNCTPTINNIDNKNNKKNINNKKEINIINNIEYIKEKIDDDMDVNEKITTLLSRMDSVTMEELENKRGLFINWIKENITPTEQKEIEKKVEEKYNQVCDKLISSANNGVNDDFFSSILVNGSTGKTVKDEQTKEEVIPSKSKEQLLEMMEEVVATSTGREGEADNFKMWVNLNEKEINSYGLMSQAEEVFQLLRKGVKEAVSATISTEVEQVPTSKDDAVKTPKNTLKTKLPQMEYNEDGSGWVRVGDTTIQVYSDPGEYDFIDKIWSDMQMASAV